MTGDAKGNPVPAAWVGEDVTEVAQAKLEGHEGLSGQKQEAGLHFKCEAGSHGHVCVHTYLQCTWVWEDQARRWHTGMPSMPAPKMGLHLIIGFS